MPEYPDMDDVTVPEELQDELDALPAHQKEPARQSLRFAVFLLTFAAVIGINLGAEYVPMLADIPVEYVTAMTWQLVLLALGFIGARTVRNTK